MSRLWICQEKTAKIPFFAEEHKINLYSLEELCYYLYQNAQLLEEGFFNEKMLGWLEQELGCAKTAEKLRAGISQEKNSFWCIEQILKASGYYTGEELLEIHRAAQQETGRDPVERGRIRAERLLQNGRYKGAVAEYRKLVLSAEGTAEEYRFWHNMGTAYAGLFLFQPAAECYKKAYDLGKEPESRSQYLLARSCCEEKNPESLGAAKSRRQTSLEEQKAAGNRNRYEKEVYQVLEEMIKEYMRSE